MNPRMKELLEKKLEQGKELSDDQSNAQMSVLKDLKGQMGGMMGDKMNKLKKVSVMSDSKEGLKEGLEKAEQMLPNGESSEPMEEDHKGEIYQKAMEMSPEELDACIQELQMLKDQKMSGSES